ncbi:MAG TPA: hypothetical protein VGF24_09325 [Vicinamibacterales bacterium]
MRVRILVLAGTAILTFGSAAASAQWLHYRTPGIPRLADGTPDLAAPAPRLSNGKPDLSGIWSVSCLPGTGCNDRALFFDLAAGLPPDSVRMTPWAAAIQKAREARDHIDDPFGYCLPMGVPRMTVSTAFKILVTPGVTAFLHELATGPEFRQIFTDGRPLPTATEPTWLGYSIGRWEGDDFVVESKGFKDGGWLDTLKARPNSDALQLTERFRRTDFGHMRVAITIDDPKAYLASWTMSTTLNLMADTELLESFCDGHEKTMEHRRITPPPPEPHSPSLPKN